jgi:hypothetical protein
VIKQFNFYDIYGYLLPGMLLLGLFWLPVGILTGTWPNQDISNALYLAVLAYIIGHVLQSIANSVVPSTRPDRGKHRFPSDLLLDKSNSKLSADFKARLSGQAFAQFGLDLGVTQDGDGESAISKNRKDAFFQARSYLIAKKAAQYAEQFEGLYAMMRGLGCAFLAGAAYFVGCGLSIRRGGCDIRGEIATLMWVAIALALISGLVSFYHEPAKKIADRLLAAFLLLVLTGSGFLTCAWRFQAQPGSIPFPSNVESIFWGGTLLALFAAVRCFSAYKAFALAFAETVWRDFSANLSVAEPPAQITGGGNNDE